MITCNDYQLDCIVEYSASSLPFLLFFICVCCACKGNRKDEIVIKESLCNCTVLLKGINSLLLAAVPVIFLIVLFMYWQVVFGVFYYFDYGQNFDAMKLNYAIMSVTYFIIWFLNTVFICKDFRNKGYIHKSYKVFWYLYFFMHAAFTFLLSVNQVVLGFLLLKMCQVNKQGIDQYEALNLVYISLLGTMAFQGMAITDRPKNHRPDLNTSFQSKSTNRSQYKKYQLSLIHSESNSRNTSILDDKDDNIWERYQDYSQRYTPHQLVGSTIPPTMITSNTTSKRMLRQDSINDDQSIRNIRDSQRNILNIQQRNQDDDGTTGQSQSQEESLQQSRQQRKYDQNDGKMVRLPYMKIQRYSVMNTDHYKQIYNINILQNLIVYHIEYRRSEDKRSQVRKAKRSFSEFLNLYDELRDQLDLRQDLRFHGEHLGEDSQESSLLDQRKKQLSKLLSKINKQLGYNNQAFQRFLQPNREVAFFGNHKNIRRQIEKNLESSSDDLYIEDEDKDFQRPFKDQKSESSQGNSMYRKSFLGQFEDDNISNLSLND